jgi:hypothetical protein
MCPHFDHDVPCRAIIRKLLDKCALPQLAIGDLEFIQLGRVLYKVAILAFVFALLLSIVASLTFFVVVIVFLFIIQGHDLFEGGWE